MLFAFVDVDSRIRLLRTGRLLSFEGMGAETAIPWLPAPRRRTPSQSACLPS